MKWTTVCADIVGRLILSEVRNTAQVGTDIRTKKVSWSVGVG